MKVLSIMTISPENAAAPPSQAEMERMGAFIAELRGRGVLVDTGGRSTDMLELTAVRKDGKLTVTDGPFTEAKEVVGGFALMEVQDRDEAVALTKRFLEIIGEGSCTLHEIGPTP